MFTLTSLQSKLDDNTQASAKRGQLHDAVTQPSSPKRQLRTSLSLHAPNMTSGSTMVSSQSTASHRLSAELADTLALQTWDGENQMQNSGHASQTDKLGGFDFGHDTQPNDLGDFDFDVDVNSPHQDPAIRMMLDQFCNLDSPPGGFQAYSVFRDILPEDPQSAANNMEGYHTPRRISPDVLQHRSQRSWSESSTHSVAPDEPYPSVETSRGSTRQSSVSTSIATEAQNTISRIRDQVLECQNDPVWFELPPHIKARLTARFTSILESCSIPVTTPHKAQTPNRRKQNANKVSSPGSSKRSNADLWYAKFMTVQVAAQKVPDAIQHYLNQPASVFLNPPAVMDACEAMSRNISEAGRKSILAKRVAYMQTLSASSIHLSILININCLFFFLLSHESLSRWKSKCQDAVAQKLWHTKLPSLFEMLHPGEPMEYLNTSVGRATKTKKYQDFSAQVRGWQKRGSQLAYFVQQVGFGSIVLLHEQLEKPYGLSRGLESVESSGIFANRKPSEVAFQHLHDGGILQVGNSTGATEFVQRILLELFQGFDEWRNFGGEFGFPGFEQVEL